MCTESLGRLQGRQPWAGVQMQGLNIVFPFAISPSNLIPNRPLQPPDLHQHDSTSYIWIYIRFLLFSPSSKPTKTTKEHESKHHIPSSRDCSKMSEFPSLGTQPIHHNYSIQIDPKEFPRLFQQFALLTFDFCWEIPEIREALDVLERNLLGEDTLWEVWRICLIRGL